VRGRGSFLKNDKTSARQARYVSALGVSEHVEIILPSDGGRVHGNIVAVYDLSEFYILVLCQF
jgi:hypothetical protein